MTDSEKEITRLSNLLAVYRERTITYLLEIQKLNRALARKNRALKRLKATFEATRGKMSKQEINELFSETNAVTAKLLSATKGTPAFVCEKCGVVTIAKENPHQCHECGWTKLHHWGFIQGEFLAKP